MFTSPPTAYLEADLNGKAQVLADLLGCSECRRRRRRVRLALVGLAIAGAVLAWTGGSALSQPAQPESVWSLSVTRPPDGTAAEATAILSTVLLTVRPNGTIEFGPDYRPDKAARAFWDAVEREGRVRRECRPEPEVSPKPTHRHRRKKP